MNAFRFLILAGSLLTISFAGYAVIHAMNPNLLTATDETSRQQPEARRNDEAQARIAPGRETISLVAPAKGSDSLVARAKGSEPTDVTKAARIEDVRGLRTEIVRLRAEVVALAARLAAVEQPDSVDDGDISPMGLDEVASQAELNEKTYRRIEAMDFDFYAETVDARWSPDATELIGQAFEAKELAGTDVVDMQCRANQCRLEVAHEDSTGRGAFELWFPALVSTMLPRATFNHIQEEDGRSRTVIYLDRED